MGQAYDVVIIGSGPAGCAAAIRCRRYGLSTLIITGKSKEADFNNAEGLPSESIQPGVVSALAQLGAAHCVDIASQGVYEGTEVNDQYNPLGSDEYGAWKGHHINRALFDAALLQTAVKQGANALDKDAVVDLAVNGNRVEGVITKAGTLLKCRYVIDASGHKRLGGKKLRFKESYYSPPLAVWTGISSGITDSLFKKNCAQFISCHDGWTWLAPELHGKCTWTRMVVKSKQQLLPPPELNAYSHSPEIKKSNRRWRVFRPVCKEGVLLCGDAAGIIDPAAGQGIFAAIVSAAMAAKTIKACFTNPDFEALYLARYDDWFITDYLDKVNRLKYFYNLLGIGIFEAGK